jgi:ADP-ribose pyrophosphatase YjhB (NUDIX family)
MDKLSSNYLYLTDKQLAIYESNYKLPNDFDSDKHKYRNVYCVNCGEKGHIVKDCDGPITSFGILAFKISRSPLDECFDKNDKLQEILNLTNPSSNTVSNKSTYPKVKFLMIQRKDTMGYIDFIRGKYPENDEKAKQELLDVCLHEMIHDEKMNLLTKSFDTLWDELWINKNSKTYKNEYSLAKSKYEKLDVKSLVSNSRTLFDFQEFGFPKGRRNMKETNIACAEREFYEETGYTKAHYDFIKNYPTVHEEFIGTNGIRYRHIYYLVKMKDNIPAPRIDQRNIVQIGEVQNIGWFSYEECMRLIRPYDLAKKKCIEKVYSDILDMKDNFICSNFYYNNKRLTERQHQIGNYGNFFQSRSL